MNIINSTYLLLLLLLACSYKKSKIDVLGADTITKNFSQSAPNFSDSVSLDTLLEASSGPRPSNDLVVDSLIVENDLFRLFQFEQSELKILFKKEEDRLKSHFYRNQDYFGKVSNVPRNIIYNDHGIYFYTNSKDSSFYYQCLLSSGEIHKLGKSKRIFEIIDIQNSDFVFFDEAIGSITKLGYQGNVTKITNISSLLTDDLEFVNSYKISNADYILEFGNWAGGYFNMKYFIYTFNTDKVVDISQKMYVVNKLSTNFDFFIPLKGKKAFVNASFLSDEGIVKNQKPVILDLTTFKVTHSGYDTISNDLNQIGCRFDSEGNVTALILSKDKKDGKWIFFYLLSN